MRSRAIDGHELPTAQCKRRKQYCALRLIPTRPVSMNAIDTRGAKLRYIEVDRFLSLAVFVGREHQEGCDRCHSQALSSSADRSCPPRAPSLGRGAPAHSTLFCAASTSASPVRVCLEAHAGDR